MRYLLILLLGLVIGGGSTVFFLGVPPAKAVPGTRVQPPQADGDPPATVVVMLSNSFFDGLLGTIFQNLGPPSFQLAGINAQDDMPTVQSAIFQGCTNTITLAPEGSGARTQVQFIGGKILAPLAFSGSYNLLGNCMPFKGWAQTSIQLSFDQGRQTVYGRLDVEGVNLEGVAPFANNFLTVFVRSAIDQRVNPLELLRAPQLQLLIPVRASNGSVKALVKDVRAEVQEGTLRLHITYDFSGERGETK
jgi:hypothetical protein